MLRYALVYLLFASLSYGQDVGPRSVSVASPGDGRRISEVALDEPVITIKGLCDTLSGDNPRAPACKTVITRIQFEKLVNAVQPGMPAHGRREFAERYADALVMSRKAEEIGLDKEARFEEQMKVARVQILAQDLKKILQERALQVSDEDIKSYYQKNSTRFEKAEIERIYVPKAQEVSASPVSQVTTADQANRSARSEQTMEAAAVSLRARAAGGEEFVKLQADAYRAAGIKSAAPNTSMIIRRISLPPSQRLVMDLGAGEISSVLADSNGYYIYKIKSKGMVPLDQVQNEIRATLSSERMEEALHGLQASAVPALDKRYFAP